MESKEFSAIRRYLGKSQSELAKLLCVSPKAVQSFEQGWRNIPASAERQLLFLLSLKRKSDEKTKYCWEIRGCPVEWRENCAAWEFKAGHLCWFINGTFCQGKCHEKWEKKIELCRRCEVYQSMLPAI
jgi:DNA-binding XRE family transcriptional regulator